MPPGPPEPRWDSPAHIRALLMMAATAVGIVLCYRLVAPFVPAIAGALALAVLVAPLHRWLERRLSRGNAAAFASVCVAIAVVGVPLLLVASRVIDEAIRGASALQALLASGSWRRLFEQHALLAPIGQWIDRQVDLAGAVAPAATWMHTGASFLQGSLAQAIAAVVTFYFLFYMLRDRAAAMAALRALSPLSAADMGRLFDDVVDTVHATVYGTLVVACVQGALGGLMFWWLGLPQPLLWGIVMGMLAVVPVLGAFVIWVPAAIFLALDGHLGKALLLSAWGSLVVGGIDNLLYPMVVGRRLKMHTLVAFVAIVGGLLVFGPAGLILGPVVFAITRLLLEIWSRPHAAPAATPPDPSDLRDA
jgi:predicted PurR-regulated permease PerM